MCGDGTQETPFQSWRLIPSQGASAQMVPEKPWNDSSDAYTTRNFDADYPGALVVGTSTSRLCLNVPLLHDFQGDTLGPCRKSSFAPARRLQLALYACIIKRFGTPEYKNLPNIKSLIYPFRTASDSSDDG